MRTVWDHSGVSVLDAWDAKAQAQQQPLEKQVAASRAQLAQCDSIDHAIEVLNAVSGALNFAAEPAQIIKSFYNDWKATHDAGTLAAMVVDASIAAQQHLFAAYCDKFEGPFSAHMTALREEGRRGRSSVNCPY